MFGFKQKHYQNGDIILKENDVCEDLLFIEFGIIEVYTEFEGNEFILERPT